MRAFRTRSHSAQWRRGVIATPSRSISRVRGAPPSGAAAQGHSNWTMRFGFQSLRPNRWPILDDALITPRVDFIRDRARFVEQRYFGGLSLEQRQLKRLECRSRRNASCALRTPGWQRTWGSGRPPMVKPREALVRAERKRSGRSADQRARGTGASARCPGLPPTRNCIATSRRCWLADRRGQSLLAMFQPEPTLPHERPARIGPMRSSASSAPVAWARCIAPAIRKLGSRGGDQSASRRVRQRSPIAWRGSSVKPMCSRR